jgi:biotin transporter BioY
MAPRPLPPLARLALSVIAVGAALLLNLSSVPLLRFETPFLWYFAAVLLSAWVGGRSSGILSTLLSILAVRYPGKH